MRYATSYQHPDFSGVPEAELAPRRFWMAHQVVGVSLESVIGNGIAPKSEAVEVRAEHGRWLVDCPDCKGAQYAPLTDHRFMCNNCANLAIGSLWRPVVWPKDRENIETLLEARPMLHNQNWNPGETVGDLRNEEPQPEPTDPREHAIWAGLSEADADAWVRELKARKKVSR